LVKAAVLRQKSYWMGWPGAAFPADRYEREYSKKADELGRSVGVDVEFFHPIVDRDDLEDFVSEISSSPPDGVLLILLTMNAWDMVDEIFKLGLPTVVFAPIGTAFTGHLVERSRRKGAWVISSLEMDQVARALSVIDAKVKLSKEKILVFKGDSEGPKEEKIKGLGITVLTLPRDEVVRAYEAVEGGPEVDSFVEEYVQSASSIGEPDKEDIFKAGRMYVACKALIDRYAASAITMDCLGLVGSRMIDMTPCLAFSKLNDEAIPAACEADIDALLTMILVKHLYGKPCFMNDPVPETVRNLLVAAHCTSPTRLAAYQSPREKFVLRSHSESGIGVSVQVRWREGQKITLAKFQGPERMIVGSGTVVGNIDTPPAGGCRTSVLVAMDEVNDVRDVKGFHQLLLYGDLRRDLERSCQLLGIETQPM